MWHEELEDIDVVRRAVRTTRHHRINEKWHRIYSMPDHPPAKGSHSTVLSFLHSRFVRGGEPLNFHWRNADPHAELNNARADEVISARDIGIVGLLTGPPATLPLGRLGAIARLSV